MQHNGDTLTGGSLKAAAAANDSSVDQLPVGPRADDDDDSAGPGGTTFVTGKESAPHAPSMLSP